jgi:hypothetical protein
VIARRLATAAAFEPTTWTPVRFCCGALLTQTSISTPYGRIILAMCRRRRPFTRSDRSAIVPPPPWHYAGWLINVAVCRDTANGAELVPPVLGRMTGNSCIHFADWQATTGGRELVDLVYAQYRETIVVVEIESPDGQRFNFFPFIWVDQDISLIRGLFQGWPKKFGITHLTRSLLLEHATAAPLKAGTRLGATLSVKEEPWRHSHRRASGSPARICSRTPSSWFILVQSASR